MRWKIFQWMKFLFRHSSNSRKLSRQKFHNELACVFTAHYASKNADWNQQQLTDGGVLANRNSANHPYCFLSNQKKVQIRAFLHVICKTNVSCPPPENRLQRQRERAWSQAIVYLKLVLIRANGVMFCEIYLQSVAHITTTYLFIYCIFKFF